MDRIIRLASATLDDFRSHLERHSDEDACFFSFRQMNAADRQITLIRKVIPIPEEYVIRRTANDILFEGAALVRAFQEAERDGSFLGFAHSHPSGAGSFSDKDKVVDQSILNSILNRLDAQPFYPSLIWSDGGFLNARIWTRHGVHRPVKMVTVVGESLVYQPLPKTSSSGTDDLFSRQMSVISGDLQYALSRVRVCIVGLGGTGSAVLSQITRLGVGEIVLIDPDSVERSNVSRVHGAALGDVSRSKADVAEALVRSIGLGTRVKSYCRDICDREMAQVVATCDVVFGCTDDEMGRSILSRMAYACLTPVFDMGVKISPTDDALSIKSIDARVTTLLPQEACLDCRQRISGDGVRADSLRKYAPDQAEELERAGYLGREEAAAPAVVTFTTAIAAAAINEFLHRITGLYGPTRKSSELIMKFKDSEFLRNRKAKRDGCYCARNDFRATGDKSPFLGSMWHS